MVIGVILAFLLISIAQYPSLKKMSRVESWPIIVTFFIILTIIHVMIALSLRINPLSSGWDPMTVYHSSQQLLIGQPLTIEEQVYFTAYQNNLAIVSMLVAIGKVLAVTGTDGLLVGLVIVNVIVMQSALIFSYLTARRLGGRRAAVVTLGFGIVFFTFSLWSRTFYTDTIGMFFTAASIFLLTLLHGEQKSERRILLSIGFATVIGVGYTIKPTVIFIAIAVAIVYWPSVVRLGATTLRRIIIMITIIGLLIAPTFVVQTVLAHAMNIQGKSMPLTSFVMLGLSKVCTTEECRIGAWNLADAKLYDNRISNETYERQVIDTIGNRLGEYGPFGYVQFLGQKGSWIFGDGTFYAYREGAESSARLIDGKSIITTFLHPSGKFYEAFTLFLQVVWIALLLLIALFAILQYRRSLPKPLSVIYLSLLFLTIFLLLFEGRSRYLYLYMPLFIVAGGYGAAKMRQLKK